MFLIPIVLGSESSSHLSPSGLETRSQLSSDGAQKTPDFSRVFIVVVPDADNGLLRFYVYLSGFIEHISFEWNILLM